ncbi:hypothetical protein JQC67_07860 [Aurantibacter crassamenti]|uniref:hypothetical protein n=1 Tax=Aurantibacter crassamenti TaxID=1837375 RepID=UPI001939D69F|nr:hypothetical protein [Aurantibacter crassamenti]MBM1106047.1 hypothetical protein [Aurantibacter crassamenti]
MSKIIFRNYDKNAVRQLLKEVGKERYDCALKDAGITQKPLTLEGFYFEYEMNTDNIELNLYYRYPSRITILIMPVLGYWAVPDGGWEILRK